MGSAELATYIEDVALFFEESGLPRIAGRILGLLIVCDPPYRSAPELAEQLGASKGSVSTMTRMLLGTGMIERAAVPGQRANYFRLRDDGFEQMFQVQIATLTSFRSLADRGLAVLQAEPAKTQRLRSLRALYAFFEREMPVLLAKWRQTRDGLVDDAG